ncbi:MAG: hypothetical protein ACRD96_24910, partial [Bryobacteraceae bacterium]
WQISARGGARPAWTRDGRELTFTTPDRMLASVTVETGAAEFRAGPPQPLFPMPGRGWYAPTSDGQRFLVATPAGDESASLTVVLNWTQELEK